MQLTDIDEFYSCDSIGLWKTVLGEDLHYSFGDFEKTQDIDEGMKNTIRYFYPFIEEKSNILDLGCGWGTPAQMLQTEKLCEVTGYTISEAQHEYCKQRGLNVQLGDIEKEEILQEYDYVVMFESLGHIVDVQKLFSKIHTIAAKLIIQVNCDSETGQQGRGTVFGESMKLRTASEIKQALESTGWRVDLIDTTRRMHALPTFKFWGDNIKKAEAMGYKIEGQITVLRNMIDSFYNNPMLWVASNPLVNFVATRI
jgi:cyclopropane fatty-acyl-phospholipid synthase-like methyltransferase